MDDLDLRIDKLSESLTDEIVGSVGLPKTRFTHWLFRGFFRKVTDRLAFIGVPFDQKVGDEGLPDASTWCLTHFCNPVQHRGVKNIPGKGPLLVVSNHPGAYDALVLFSLLGRKDIRWISTEIPFLEMLENTREHMLISSRKDTATRMVVMRNAIKHLRQGGTLVYFAAGHRDPDPAVFNGAQEAVDNWMDVFDTFNKYVPRLQILPAMISGVVSETWARHPLTRLRRKQIDKHRLAEFGQVITQLMKPGKLMITPSVSIGKPISGDNFHLDSEGEGLRQVVITHAKALLTEHSRDFNRQYS